MCGVESEEEKLVQKIGFDCACAKFVAGITIKNVFETYLRHDFSCAMWFVTGIIRWKRI